MTEAIVGIVALLLIIYLFIVILRPEWKFDNLFRKHSGTAPHSVYGSRHKSFSNQKFQGKRQKNLKIETGFAEKLAITILVQVACGTRTRKNH